MLAAAESAPEGILSARFPATFEAVSAELGCILGTCERRGLGAGLRADLAIVLGEVLNNIVEHAVPQAAEGWIEVEVTHTAGRLQVETVDAGVPLPPQLLSGAALPDMGDTPVDLPEGGFGWFIIHALAKDMVYEREGGRNRLSFCCEERREDA